MNKITRRAVIGCAAVSIAFGAAQLPAAAQSKLDRIESEGKITVGIANAINWAWRGEDGKVVGFSPDLLRAAFEPLGVKEFDFVLVDWNALIPSLQTRRFDVIAAGMWITPVRCKSVAFSDPDLTISDAMLVDKGNPHNIHSYEDLTKNPELRVGASRGSADIEHMTSAGVPEKQILQFQDDDAVVAALVAGRIDGAPFGSTAMPRMLKALAPSVERAMPFTGYIKDGHEVAGWSAIAFRLDDTNLRDAYNKRLVELKADGTVAKLMQKYGIEANVNDTMTVEKACSDK
ncbi:MULTISPECIES: ectoine/hydroxyectoine ABC transporter substrate-binding protein EhuB [Mesorhizobium]|uniref:ectoine/hydroxyectoine ABC transporter substrate-binding protein EhuB n=1 Tax=Mesorhizobium TaxID=68287 RepID=UPI000BAF7429|nr:MULTISPECIES: ectoine/hydroxyectoine ABC transporter substrate-binding protein EhuB [Mesorhizobium]PBB58183.1 ectoine/hydroxyectoine ABC transporter substrate-binding protein EhuB [Mesorhizobium loti]PBB83388.1 ectoine/hydroxyectoine ABC transporter substrate-binding protein EhuB [Mesorhizobium sp. WSM3876]